jgi:SAM-dependent methyltransferase
MLDSASSPLRRLRDLPVVREAASARYTVAEAIRIRRAARRARTSPDDFDRVWGVQTRVALGLIEFCRILGHGGHDHEPSPPARFLQIVGSLDVRFEDTVFVDCGSGAGRAVALASAFPFKEVIGVELSPALHARAQATVAAIQGADGRWAPVRLVCGDITTYALPPEPLVIYLYNPFGPRPMRRLLAGIEASLGRRPRPVTLVAFFCNHNVRPVLDASPVFRTVRRTRDVLVLRDRISAGG